jgi:hypothetical protein
VASLELERESLAGLDGNGGSLEGQPVPATNTALISAKGINV